MKPADDPGHWVESPTQGRASDALEVELPFWPEERAQWRRVLPWLWQYEHLRHWDTPALLRNPGTDAVILAELAPLGALAATTRPP